MERVIIILERRVPDRVLFFLPITMRGASACGLSIEEYFPGRILSSRRS